MMGATFACDFVRKRSGHGGVDLDVARQIGPYHVLGPLGAGGMGEVYLAEDSRLGRKVAIKVLSSKHVINDEARGRFLREARSIANLDHPNICTLYEIGNDAGLDYLVMQYIEGETLAQRTSRQPFALGQALDVSVEIGEGLMYAHSRGIVHRDIKPQNIMFTVDGRVKLMDFGVAKSLDAAPATADSETALFVTQAGIPVGTIEYMAPEQIEGAPPDVRSDIFSFAIVLYQLFGQKHPFLQESFNVTLAAILTRDPDRLHDLPPAVEPELARILNKALAKRPAERYQTARELTGDLRAVRQRLHELGRAASATMAAAEMAAITAATAPPVQATRAQAAMATQPLPARKSGPPAWVWAAGLLLLAGIAAIALLPSGAMPWSHRAGETADGAIPSPPSPPMPGASAGLPRSSQRLNWWLEVQSKKIFWSKTARSVGDETFHSGNRFRLGVEQSQSNWFYLLDESPSPSGQAFTLLYPNSGKPAAHAAETADPQPRNFYTDWYVFDRSPGTETLWMVSSEIPVAEIESLKLHLNNQEKGSIRDPREIEALQSFFRRREDDKIEMRTVDSPKHAEISYHGTLVKALNLVHR